MPNIKNQGGIKMRINNNLMAMNAYRQLGITNNSAAKAMEKLSSGYRINRAGDDAAGLAISEKMRGQIRGLNMAAKNAQDGISLIQTAEGALTETHAILQRMRELAVQAANDTNVEVDRKELQKEINGLIDEIDRIGITTQFNTRNLIDGSFDGTFHIGANEGQNIKLKIADMRSDNIGQVTVKEYETVADIEVETNFAGSGNDESFTITVDGQGHVITLSENYGSGQGVVEAINAQLSGTGVTASLESGNKLKFSSKENFGISNASGTIASGLNVSEIDITTGAMLSTLRVNTDTESTGGILTQDDANNAITAINNAIESVSAERAKLGAYQNRLEHTIKNLDTSAENLQAAESRIRDVDMAKEMMEFTKNNILQQAATAMLAQANQMPSGVLQLLR